MATISKKRQEILKSDENTVRKLYDGACQRFTKEKVDKDLTRLWDLRCIWGMQNVLPFRSTLFVNVKEMLWIAVEVCGFGVQNKESASIEADSCPGVQSGNL